jgi:hypothetical protein
MTDVRDPHWDQVDFAAPLGDGCRKYRARVLPAAGSILRHQDVHDAFFAGACMALQVVRLALAEREPGFPEYVVERLLDEAEPEVKRIAGSAGPALRYPHDDMGTPVELDDTGDGIPFHKV